MLEKTVDYINDVKTQLKELNDLQQREQKLGKKVSIFPFLGTFLIFLRTILSGLSDRFLNVGKKHSKPLFLHTCISYSVCLLSIEC